MTTTIATQLALTILISGSLFALSAVGFTLVYRVTKIMHVAHGVVVLGSGYAFWWALQRGASASFAVAFTIAVALAMGWCIHTFVYERLRTRGKIAITMSLVATVALLVLGQNILLALFGSSTRVVSFSKQLSSADIHTLIVGVSLVSIIFLGMFLRWSRLGKRMRAVADNSIAAEVVGIDSARVRLSAILLSAVMGGIVGILYAMEFNLDPSMGSEIAIRSFSRVLIGGAGSLPGAIFGSFLIEGVEDVGAFFYSDGLKSVFSFVIVFLFLLLRPRGLFGRKIRKEDL
ncbi:MAG: branched-chain amino acid ABC transporter permease [bacterium]|nr:branched-chain amino acid ABC transporter permease [bacterium]